MFINKINFKLKTFCLDLVKISLARLKFNILYVSEFSWKTGVKYKCKQQVLGIYLF